MVVKYLLFHNLTYYKKLYEFFIYVILMDLYRDIDIQAITDKLDSIVDLATDIKDNTLFPTFIEKVKAKKIIMNFIKEKKRVIYGGTAYNELIKNKTSKERIYSEKEEVTKDVEFYTPEPIMDMIELCDLLRNDFEYVAGSDAQHEETFSIFVQFENMCDISYMPKHIYNNMPRLTINGFQYTHPSFILVDILRQYNDPLLSYWRLKDKTFSRANMLLKYYPLDLHKGKPDFPPPSKINGFVFDMIKNIPSLIHLGSIAYNYYINTKEKHINTDQPLVCMSTNLKEDSNNIYKLITKKYKIRVEEYWPFFQFWDRRVVYYYDNYPVLTLVGHNRICLPYHSVTYSDNKFKSIQLGGVYKELLGGEKEPIDINNTMKMGTFILLILYLLIDLHYCNINKLKKEAKTIENMLYTLLDTRKKYLTEKNITVMDKSPYQEFILECYGKTVNPKVDSHTRRLNRKKRGLAVILRYTPNEDDKNAEKYKINFENSSGNTITNPKKLYVNNIISDSDTDDILAI